MALFFLASIAGLFPRLALPAAVGWKELQVFDLVLVTALLYAAKKGAISSLNRRLLFAGVTFLGAMGLALWAHPSPQGVRTTISLAYSVAVLLTVAHVRIDALGVRADRVILWPMLLTIGISGVVFFIENVLGLPVASNQSAALPSSVHRLGGLTGANALILFLCLSAPLVRRPLLTLLVVLLPAFATLSRSMMGVGVALIAGRRASGDSSKSAESVVAVVSWFAVALGLFAYLFAVVPIEPSQRTTLQLSLAAGGYLTPHQAACRMFWSSPFTGVGPARFADRYEHFTSSQERNRIADHKTRRDPHSALLGLAAEQGLAGLVSFGWLLVEIYRRLGRIRDPDLRRAAASGLTGLLIGGHFVDWLALKGLWLWIGLLVASGSQPRGSDERGNLP